MNVEIKPTPAKARCYKCGSPNLKGICHHCGRGVCEDHSKSELPVRLGLWNSILIGIGIKSLDHKDFAMYEPGFSRLSFLDEVLLTFKLVKIDNLEFGCFTFDPVLNSNAGIFDKIQYGLRKWSNKLKLAWGNEIGQKIASPIHCEFCVHKTSRYPTISWIGLVLTITVIGAPIGVILLILAFILNRMFYIQELRNQITSIPIQGKLGSNQIKEEYDAHIVLDGSGRYSTKVGMLLGKLKIPLRFDSNDYLYYQAFKQRADLLNFTITDNLPVDIGFVKIEGANWEFISGDICMQERINIVQLRTNQKNDQFAAMLDSDERSGGVWPVEYKYQLTGTFNDDKGKNHKLPIQAIISIRSESNRQALDIAFELIDPKISGARNAKISFLDIFIPNVLGKIERVEPEGKIDESAKISPTREGQFQSISWKKLSFYGQNPKVLRRSIYIQFKEPLTEDVRLEGEMEVVFPSALSGTKQPYFFFPSGEFRDNLQSNHKANTHLSIDLDLDLSGLRYQKMHIVEQKIFRESVVLDSVLISEIIKTLAEGNFYTKRVTENPARTSKEGAQKINRYWDISGRRYEGVYPIDFHIVLTGEVIGLKDHYIAGNLKVDISVQGAVTNDEMIAIVENTSIVLHKLTSDAVAKVPLVSYDETTSSRIGLASGSIGKQISDEEIQTQGTPVKVIKADQPNIEILKPVVNGENAERVRVLQKRLELLEDRLLDGDISEKLYSELKRKNENELWVISGGILGRQDNN